MRFVADRRSRRLARALSDRDPRALNAELASRGAHAVRRGLKLSSYPVFEAKGGRAHRPHSRVRLLAAQGGIDRRVPPLRLVPGASSAAPIDRNYVIRPGAVNPCIYWNGDVGFYPADSLSGSPAALRGPHPRRPAVRRARRDVRDLRRAPQRAVSPARTEPPRSAEPPRRGYPRTRVVPGARRLVP